MGLHRRTPVARPGPFPLPAPDPTTDGTCGKQNGGKTCKGWPLGECCSPYGWCGDTTDHCGKGCQSGPCNGGETPGPGPTQAPVTGGGKFDIIGESGVPAMHAGLMPNGRVFFLDKVEVCGSFKRLVWLKIPGLMVLRRTTHS